MSPSACLLSLSFACFAALSFRFTWWVILIAMQRRAQINLLPPFRISYLFIESCAVAFRHNTKWILNAWNCMCVFELKWVEKRERKRPIDLISRMCASVCVVSTFLMWHFGVCSLLMEVNRLHSFCMPVTLCSEMAVCFSLSPSSFFCYSIRC